MNFAEIIYQSALFTATFFIFNRVFSRYIFKNREILPPSMGHMVSMFLFYLVLGSTINYFVEKYKIPAQQISAVQLTSGQSMVAPTSNDVQTPLKVAVDFIDDIQPVELTTVKTDLAEYVFSSNGATLQSMILLWQNGEKIPLLSKGTQHFALALDGPSPVNYNLVRSDCMQNDIHELVYQARLNHGIIEKKFVLHTKTYQIDVQVNLQGLGETEQLRLLAPMPVTSTQLQGIVNSATTSDKIKLQNIALDKSDSLAQFWFEPKVFGFTSHYFINVCFASNSLALGRTYFKQLEDKTYQAIFESKPCQQDAQLSWSFYFGPKITQDLAAVSPVLTSIVDYGMLSFLAKPLARFLFVINNYVGSYGWAIILLTLLIKLLMVPFTLRGERGMREQAEFEKKRQHLQQKFKHDKAALDKATAELISKHGLPIFSSCLPMLLNIPVFIALNKVLSSSTELYGASFLWLPDLSVADPYYILSLLTFVGMILTPGLQASVQIGPRQMFSKIGFALFLAGVTSCLASGLALFIVLNTLFSVAQTFVVSNVRRLAGR